MINIREIKSSDDFELFKSMGDELHIIKFGAPWCGPCRSLEDIIKSLDQDKIGNTLFAEVNIDEDETEDLAVENNIRNIPVLLFMKDGVELRRIAGLTTANNIYKSIEELS